VNDELFILYTHCLILSQSVIYLSPVNSLITDFRRMQKGKKDASAKRKIQKGRKSEDQNGNEVRDKDSNMETELDNSLETSSDMLYDCGDQ
jgi:hypothetical protein